MWRHYVSSGHWYNHFLQGERAAHALYNLAFFDGYGIGTAFGDILFAVATGATIIMGLIATLSITSMGHCSVYLSLKPVGLWHVAPLCYQCPLA